MDSAIMILGGLAVIPLLQLITIEGAAQAEGLVPVVSLVIR